MIQIHISAYFFFALVLLVIPLDWVISILVAAVFHEVCHCAAIFLAGGQINTITIKADGAAIEACIPETGKELICAAAGPVGSILLLLFCHVVPKIAICGLIQGIVNLVPVYPLDGGRILKCCLELAGVADTGRILLYARRLTFFCTAIFAAMLAKAFSSGKILLLAVMVWILKGILRKRPCKQSQIRVQ